MSADNGIYIAKFPDGYRVAYAQAIENCWYHRQNTKARKKVLKDYFGKSKVFDTQEGAERYAFELYHEMQKEEEEYGMFGYLVLEYGISYIGEFEEF